MSQPPSIVHVVGARPNFIKVGPVHRALARCPDVSSRIVHTGQHYDRAMSDVFFEELRLPRADVNLGVGSGTHAQQTAAIMVALESYMAEQPPALVAVYGDVNSTVAAALVCAKLGIPIAHIEAGLRSGDRSMPEEINRIVTDRLAELLLVTEPSGRRNLLGEGVPAGHIVDTGNAMIDSLEDVLRRENIRERPAAGSAPLVLVTLHRPSNVDDSHRLRWLVDVLQDLARDAKVLFPVHPRTRARLERLGLPHSGTAVRLVAPMSYVAFVRELVGATLVLTDSGGVQEETAYLGIPCLTLRANTERPITVEAGTNLLERDCDGDVLAAARALMRRQLPPIGQNPVLRAAQWDGHAGERIAGELVRFVGSSGNFWRP